MREVPCDSYNLPDNSGVLEKENRTNSDYYCSSKNCVRLFWLRRTDPRLAFEWLFSRVDVVVRCASIHTEQISALRSPLLLSISLSFHFHHILGQIRYLPQHYHATYQIFNKSFSSLLRPLGRIQESHRCRIIQKCDISWHHEQFETLCT
jgi:hypothetical protein